MAEHSTATDVLGPLIGLGYIGVSSEKLSDWASFAIEFAGMQQVDDGAGRLVLRMDERAQRLLVRDDGERGFFGWEVRDRAALDMLADRFDRSDTPYQPLTRSACDERFVGEGLWFLDPAGNRIEAFHSPAIADAFTPGRNISGFRTGALGMGHAVLLTPDPEPVRRFYTDVLGFRLSDYTDAPFEASFYHLNPRHHSLAIVTGAVTGVHHLMVELENLDDVGQGYDIAQRRPNGVGVTLGRHSNDHMTSFYARTPSGFMLEYGWGGRSIDPDTWQPYELVEGPSLWGHDRDWLPPDLQAEAVRLRMQAATDGRRSPVHVHAGNYEVTDVSTWRGNVS